MAKNLKVAQPYANAFIQMTSGKKDSLDKIVIELNQFKDSSKDLESKVSILSERITSFSGVKEVLDE